MDKVYIGIDNGVTGSIGVVRPDGINLYTGTPVKKEQSYTKKQQNISRVKVHEFLSFMRNAIKKSEGGTYPVFIVMERPLSYNPFVVKKSMLSLFSGMRCLEAELICIEILDFPYQYVDSKEWQKDMLPVGIKGSEQLKLASAQIGKRLFPDLYDDIIKQKDADGLLMAEWAKRRGL